LTFIYSIRQISALSVNLHQSGKQRYKQIALNINSLTALLLVAVVVSLIGRKMHLPYTVGLVLSGTALALSPLSLNFGLSKSLIFNLFLPPLVFEAALQIPWKDLRKDLVLIVTLATLGVVVAAAITAVGMHFVVGWPWEAAILLGVLLSATDPVSVIATFKETDVQGRLRLLVESESLFNDGTAAVMFSVAIAMTAGAKMSVSHAASAFIITVFGGVVCGGVVAAFGMLLAGQTEDHLLEITITVIVAYGSFLLAEHFFLSGVMAALTAGIVVGNWRSTAAITERGRGEVVSIWDFIAFVVNTFVFLLIGVQLAHHGFRHLWGPITCAVLLVVVGRAVGVYGCSGLFSRGHWRVSAKYQHIMFWGGLRGALALALVLGLPDSLPDRGVLITVTFAVVAFSVIIQGLTVPILLRRLSPEEAR
jgi:CPA1 family monovalent cation:H+ antiporter